MNNYYVSTRISNNSKVTLKSIETSRSIYVLMIYPNGYCSIMPYQDFKNRLDTAKALGVNPILDEIQKELEMAVATPVYSEADLPK